MMNGILTGENGEPLIAANIYASDAVGRPDGSNQGTTTDNDGRFKIDFPATHVAFRYLGYRTMAIPNRTGFVIIEMLPAPVQGPVIVVKPKPRLKKWFPWLALLIGGYYLTRR
jgi:hypothetical protein